MTYDDRHQLILIPCKTFIDLCFVFKQLASLKKRAIKFEQAQISRKLAQAIIGSQTRHKHAQAKNFDDFRSRVIRTLQNLADVRTEVSTNEITHRLLTFY